LYPGLSMKPGAGLLEAERMGLDCFRFAVQLQFQSGTRRLQEGSAPKKFG